MPFLATLLILVALAGLGACATTLPLEAYRTETVPEYPTEVVFEADKEEVWEAVLRLLARRRDPIELAEPGVGRVTTTWTNGPSLIHFHERLGAPGTRSPLPARYRLSITLTEEQEGTKVTVIAEEETNFLILTGTDPNTGRAYYRDDWRATPTRTARENELLQPLRQLIETR